MININSKAEKHLRERAPANNLNEINISFHVDS